MLDDTFAEASEKSLIIILIDHLLDFINKFGSANFEILCRRTLEMH